jgi:dihydrodipicolinate synthase/N-acetylneuraminate lyase
VEGVLAAAITPLRGDGREPDVGATLELIDFLCRSGVRGIALLGSTGEFLNPGFDERIRLAYMAVKRSRVPVLVGAAHATLDGALELGREASSAGAEGLLLMPPYFFRYGQAEIREFYLQYVAQMGRGVPVYLYNIPAFTSPISCETAIQLLSTGLFAGIKDSSGDLDYLRRVREACAGRPVTVLAGNDSIFAEARRMGVDGVVSGPACAVPELMLALDRALLAGDVATSARLEARLSEFLAWIVRFPAPVAIKAACGARGIKTGPLAVPLAPENQRLLDEFREWFRAWLPTVKQEAAHA